MLTLERITRLAAAGRSSGSLAGLAVGLAAAFIATNALAAKIHVYEGESIQAAIDGAVDGDEILVHPGTYYEGLSFKGKEIVVNSTHGASSTVVDGHDNTRVVTIASGQGRATVLDGFTITRGNAGTTWGGGLWIEGSPTIRHCVFADNYAHNGGGLASDGGDPLIQYCTFTMNETGDNGAGLYILNGSPVVEDCLILENTCLKVGDGGGMMLGYASAVVSRCAFIDNYAPQGSTEAHGGAVVCYGDGPVVFDDCLFQGNVAENGKGGAVYCGNGALDLEIVACELRCNDASVGGAIYNKISGGLSVESSLFCGNTPNDISGTWIDFGGNLFSDACNSIEVIDPQEGLLDGQGWIAQEYQKLSSSSVRHVKGLAADGITPVLLRLETPGPGDVTFSVTDAGDPPSDIDVGLLATIDAEKEGTVLSVDVVALGGDPMRYMAFAVLIAPLDFVRDDADHDKTARPINISAVFDPSGSGDPFEEAVELELHRPPVMLLHGLWSDGDTWEWHWVPIRRDDERFVIWRGDYESTHADSFATNVDTPRLGVQNAVDKIRTKRGIAATQADVFGHSMGGILSRMYITSDEYVRADNFGAGDIHKLITVDTPHAGSPLAWTLYLLEFLPPPHQVAVRLIARALDHCIDCGAMEDLQPDSDAIAAIAAFTGVPTHAIIGKGGSDMIAQGFIWSSPLLMLTEWMGLMPEDLFPEGMQHDWIVGRLSQEGGLETGSDQISVFGLDPPDSWGTHFSITEDDDVADKAIELLNAPVSGSDTVFADGFPKPAAISPPIPPWHPIVRAGGRDGGLIIVEPEPGTVIPAGQPLLVTVAGVDGFVPDRTIIACEFDSLLLEDGGLTGEIDIPAHATGSLALAAASFDAQDVVAAAEEVIVQVEVPASLIGLSFDPDLVFLYEFLTETDTTVIGHFDDGVDRELSGSAVGTEYESDDVSIVTVNEEGIVSSAAPGTAIVRAMNGGFSAEVLVKVKGVPCPPDLNGDGIVDVLDLLAVLAAWGSCPECIEDITGDGIVDVLDLLEVLGAWGPC